MPPKRSTSTANSTTSNVPPPAPPPQKHKKPAIPWDKDGTNGNTSIRILLDWLAVDGNYQRWRGDNKGGASKSTLANEILQEMIDAGIHHCDAKGIQTKIQELHVNPC